MVKNINEIYFKKNKQNILTTSCNSTMRNINFPLIELDILYLNECFTTPGVHSIVMPNITIGRMIINTILNSLRCYHDIGFFSFSKCDIMDILHMKNNVQDIVSIFNTQFTTEESMALFFINNFYYDFIWIENHNKNSNTEKIKTTLFEEEILNFKINHIIPVIKIFYKNSDNDDYVNIV